MKTVELNMSLCKGRHEIEAAKDGSIFDCEIADVTNTEAIENQALEVVKGLILKCKCKPHINLYVTGLTVALIAAINACNRWGVKVTLYHFNRDTGDYYPQEVW